MPKTNMKLSGKVVSKDECLFCPEGSASLGCWLVRRRVYWEGMLALCKDCLKLANSWLKSHTPSLCGSCKRFRGSCDWSGAGQECASYQSMQGQILLKHLHMISDYDGEPEVADGRNEVRVGDDLCRMIVGFAGTGIVGNFSRIYGYPHARIVAKHRSIAVAGTFGVAQISNCGIAAARYSGCLVFVEGSGIDSMHRAITATAGEGIEPDMLYRVESPEVLKLVPATRADLLATYRIMLAEEKRREDCK